jgi:hypothetical protein
MRKSLVFAALFWLSSPSARADVEIMIEPGNGRQFAEQAGVDLAGIEMQLRDELRALFQTYRLGDYLRSFSDAQSFATRGLGVDYASNGRLMVGIAGNVSLNVEKGFVPRDTKTRPAVSGVSTNATLMAGMNLGFIGLEPLTIYGNYFQRSGSFDEFAADMRNWGVHLQLKLLGPGDERLVNALVRWGGFDITTGIDSASLGLGLRKNWRRDVPVGQVGKETARVAIDTAGRFDIQMSALTVPLELTTNFRFLYLVSVYGGVGFDWLAFGESSIAVDLQGKMTGLLPSQNAMFDIGTTRVTATETATPSAGRVRGLLGLQANLAIFRLFAQINLVPHDPVLASLALGVRAVF